MNTLKQKIEHGNIFLLSRGLSKKLLERGVGDHFTLDFPVVNRSQKIYDF